MIGENYWIAVASLSAIGIALVGIAVWWWRKRKINAQRRSVAKLLQGVQGTNVQPSSDIERQLLTACSGNRALVERLIRFELTRLPSLSRGKAAQSALERLRADRRG